jgi:DNA-binding transcriptional MerR regulator
MSVKINGQTYFRTSEACEKTGISRATLFRWLKLGILKKSYRDRRGWRMFTQDDLNRIKAEARRIEVEYSLLEGVVEDKDNSKEQPIIEENMAE